MNNDNVTLIEKEQEQEQEQVKESSSNTKEKEFISNMDSLNSMLNKPIDISNEPWSKLNKTSKLLKLKSFIIKYASSNNYASEEEQKLSNFLIECLDKKRLNKIKDVTYNKDSGEIIAIPALVYVKLNKRFTLKNNEKRTTTMKSLGPKKNMSV